MAEQMFKGNGALAEAERAAARAEEDAKYAERAAQIKREALEMSKFHTVTVTTALDDEGTPDESRRVESIKFACSAPPDADCRTYPESCGCDYFEWNEAKTHDVEGHERVSGKDCWLTDWFANEGAVYTGDDYDDMRDDCLPAIDRTGHIVTTNNDEYVEWEWVDSETGARP